MKKYITLLLFFAIFAFAAYQDMQKGHKQDQELLVSTQGLTMSDVKAAFEQGGLPLETWESPLRFYTLEGVVPAFYKTDSGEFAIYVFQSDVDRSKGRGDFDNQSAMAKVALSKIYEVRNVLIFELKQQAQHERMQKVIDALYGSEKPEILSMDDVKAVLQQQGVKLNPSDFKYEWFKLGLKTEYSFDLNEKEQLYVFAFDSTAEVERGLKQINVQNARYDIAHTPTPYMVNNILIMYMRYMPIEGLMDKIQAAVGTLSNSGKGEAAITKGQAFQIAIDYASSINNFKWLATENWYGAGYWEVTLGSNSDLNGQHHPPEMIWLKVDDRTGRVFDVRQTE